MDALSNGQLHVAVLGQALLPMWWNRVVYECLYPIVRKVLLQLVAFGRCYCKYVEDVPVKVNDLWQCYVLVVYLIKETSCYVAANVVIGV